MTHTFTYLDLETEYPNQSLKRNLTSFLTSCVCWESPENSRYWQPCLCQLYQQIFDLSHTWHVRRLIFRWYRVWYRYTNPYRLSSDSVYQCFDHSHLKHSVVVFNKFAKWLRHAKDLCCYMFCKICFKTHGDHILRFNCLYTFLVQVYNTTDDYLGPN